MCSEEVSEGHPPPALLLLELLVRANFDDALNNNPIHRVLSQEFSIERGRGDEEAALLFAKK